MPQPLPGWVTRHELVEGLRRVGLSCTPTQVENWHKQGLLDRPRKVGKGRAHGSESRYPPIAILQAAGVCHLRHSGWRTVPELGWGLWCLGFPPTSRARVYLERLAQRHLAQQREAMDRFEREEPGNPIERVATSRLPWPLGKVRRAVGAPFMPTLQRLWAEVDLGRTDLIRGLESSDLERMSRVPGALGWADKPPRAPAAKDQLEGATPHVIRWLEELTAGLGLDRTLNALPKVSDGILEQCRDELLALIRHAGVRSGLREPFEVVIPPGWFLTYLQGRYLHPKLRDPMHTMLTEAAKAGSIPLPRPAPAVPYLNALTSNGGARWPLPSFLSTSWSTGSWC